MPKPAQIFLIMLLGTVAFTQTAAPAPTMATSDEYLHSLTGQKLIMLHFGDTDHSKVKKSDLHKVKISCDSAVQIQAVHYKKREVTFEWIQIGTLETKNNIPRNCRDNNTHPKGTLTITELAADETAASLAESVSKVLQTPEQYLATEGISFNPQPESGVQRPASGGFVPPKVLLSVDGVFSQESLRSKYAGAVMVSFIVGTDGCAHQPKISRPLGMGLDEQALAVLPLWRFQPASKDGKPVAASMNMEMSFNLY